MRKFLEKFSGNSEFSAMTFNKNYFQVIAFLIYIAVYITFFVFAKITKTEKIEFYSCKEASCLRFCSEDFGHPLLNETVEEFNVTTEASSFEEEFIKIFGNPPCNELKILEDIFLVSSVSVRRCEGDSRSVNIFIAEFFYFRDQRKTCG